MAELPTEDEILAAATKAGWLLEQEAIRILDTKHFHPRPSWAFQDSDEPASSRELDVWSYHRFLTDEETKVTVSASILVECKQSATPYCAIGHEPPKWRRQLQPTEHVLPTDSLPLELPQPGRGTLHGSAWEVLGFKEIADRHGSTFRATQLTRLDHVKGGRWEASNAGIFTSLLYPLAKAVRATQREFRGSSDTVYLRKKGEAKDRDVPFLFVFPVVLIGSPLYVIDAGLDQPHVSQAKWVRTQRELKSKSLEGMFEFDIVNIDSFPEYIDQAVVPFVSDIADAVATDPLRYIGETWTPPEGAATEPTQA